MKYEDLLILDHKNLMLKKNELVRDLSSLAKDLIRIKDIEDKMFKLPGMPFRKICLLNKVNKIKRIRIKKVEVLKSLNKEFMEVDGKARKIEGYLIQYYDSKIEELIKSLGIEGVNTLEGVLTFGKKNE